MIQSADQSQNFYKISPHTHINTGSQIIFLYSCENALQKAVDAMSNQASMQCNKLMKLDNTMLMYGIYNAETLEKLINTVHEIHNVTSSCCIMFFY